MQNIKESAKAQSKKITKLVGMSLLAAALGTAYTASAAVPALSVKGNKVVANGKPKELVGMSLFWSNNYWGGEKFYNAGSVKGIKNFFGGNLVRAAMGVEDNGGYLSDSGNNQARVQTVVDAAIDNDMYVIIDWHSHEAENNKRQAIQFFQDMARQYGDQNNVIYEIYNEPEFEKGWSDVIKPYAQDVVNAIREIDPDNLIIVGNRRWAQLPNEAAKDPIVGKNVAYTIHFYAGSHKADVRANAQEALDLGAAIFATEWGTVNANGDGGVDRASTNQWISFMKDNKISHANWALNDKSEGASVFMPGVDTNGNWSESDLTETGKFIRQIIKSYDLYGSDSESKPVVSKPKAKPVSKPKAETKPKAKPAPKPEAETKPKTKPASKPKAETTPKKKPASKPKADKPKASNPAPKQPVSSSSCQKVQFRKGVELDLTKGNCITISRSLTNETIQFKDSDKNKSCDFRGSVTDGNKTVQINKNYVRVNDFKGDTVRFNMSNSCNYVLVKSY